MKLIPHEPTRFTEVGIGYREDGTIARLRIEGRPDEVRVRIGAQGLIFTPEKSDKHADVLKRIGEEA